MYYLIDAGSSSIKIYQTANHEVKLLEKKSYQLQMCYTAEKRMDLTEDDSNILFKIFSELKSRYLFSKSNTKIFATGHFRNIKNREKFVEDFYAHIGLYLNIIDQDLEAFYLKAKLSSYSSLIGRTIIFNIGGSSLELLMCEKGEVIDSKKLSFGVNNIRKEDFPEINDINDSNILSAAVDSIMKRLPIIKKHFDTAIYTGGELTFMQRVGYPLKLNQLFSDDNHPSIINISDYFKYNQSLFDQFNINDLLSKMPDNPTWMLGARSCSAIAQAICMRYGVKQIIPSDFNMIDGVAAQEARTAVVCGSFNRHLDKIASLINTLNSKGIRVLSPKNTNVIDNQDGFVIFRDDKMVNNCKWSVESCHLEAIKQCDMVIACNFENYIGFSTAFELGYAYSHGKKVVFLENNEIAVNFDSPSEIGLLCI